MKSFIKLSKLYELGKKPSIEYIEPDFENEAKMSHKAGNKKIKLTIIRRIRIKDLFKYLLYIFILSPPYMMWF